MFALKSSELTASYAVLSDIIYRMDMVTHRAGVKKGVGLNALFGDGHVRFEKDASFFSWGIGNYVWNSTKNGQNGGGGIEDKPGNFHWLISSLNP